MLRKLDRSGASCPPYCFSSIAEAFRRFDRELAGKYVSDPLGTRVWFMEYNFPKLIQLQYRGGKARACRAIQHLRSDNPCEDGYTFDSNRLGTLFWIPSLIEDPDSIHQNVHARIMGDEVYVKRYAKAGAAFKIAFTIIDETLNQRVVTTSFLTQEDRLEEFIEKTPKWARKSKKDVPAVEGDLPFPK